MSQLGGNYNHVTMVLVVYHKVPVMLKGETR